MTRLVMRVILAGASVYAAAGILAATGALQMPHILAASVAAAAGVVVAAAIRAASVGSMAYAAAVVVAVGGWLAWTVVDSPWTQTAATVWLGGLLLLGPIYPAMHHYRMRREEMEEWEREEQELRRRSGQWVALWARAGVKGLSEVRREETRAGLKIWMELPPDGKVTVEALQRAARAVEIAHGALRRGSVRVEEGELAHEVIVHINARDVLAETTPIPSEVAARSGAEPFDVGLHEDGTECVLGVDKHAMIVGLTDSGKTNLINAIVRRLGECVDTVIWVVDPKGGRMAAPWLLAWLEGRAARPVLDWVATTPAEWDLMLDAALAVMEARSTARLGGEKVIASATLPRIVLVIDEIADVTADHKTKEKIKRLVRKGRSEEVKLILAGQRGTVTMFGDGDLKSQLGTVIGLGVAKLADAQQIFPDDHTIAASLARMQYPGCMYVKAGVLSRALPAKAYRIEYDRIPGFAAQLADLRPGLDELSARAAGAAYAARWSWARCGHLVGAGAHPTGVGGGEGPPDDEAAFADLAARLGPAVPPILAAVEDVFERAGNPARLHTRVILAGLPPAAGDVTARRLGLLLAPLGIAPVDAWGEGDERGRGYLRQDLTTARQRIESGALEVPEAVYAWPSEP